MRLEPGTLAMTAALAMLIALGPLSTDLYLPSLPAIAKAFSTDTAAVQRTLSAYLAGFALGQIGYGPFSDRYGRRPVVMVGLGLYAVATVLCVAAPSVDWLIAARFLQALGAAGPIVLGRAIVRDLYDGPRAGQELARMGMIMGLAPAIAPVIGGVLEPLFGWRSNFAALLFISLALLTMVLTVFPETLKVKRLEPISLPGILRGFKVIGQNASFRHYASLATLTYSGLFCFISGSSFVLQQSYGLSPFIFGLSFGLSVLGFILGTIVAQRIVLKQGLDGTIRWGVVCLSVGGLSMLALMAIEGGNALEVVLPMALYAGGVGLVLPQSNAGAMMPFPDRAGAASSLQGLLQMSCAAVVGVVLGEWLSLTPLVMPLFISVAGLLALALVLTRRREEAAV